jgi:hypothetical protein
MSNCEYNENSRSYSTSYSTELSNQSMSYRMQMAQSLATPLLFINVLLTTPKIESMTGQLYSVRKLASMSQSSQQYQQPTSHHFLKLLTNTSRQISPRRWPRRLKSWSPSTSSNLLSVIARLANQQAYLVLLSICSNTFQILSYENSMSTSVRANWKLARQQLPTQSPLLFFFFFCWFLISSHVL